VLSTGQGRARTGGCLGEVDERTDEYRRPGYQREPQAVHGVHAAGIEGYPLSSRGFVPRQASCGRNVQALVLTWCALITQYEVRHVQQLCAVWEQWKTMLPFFARGMKTTLPRLFNNLENHLTDPSPTSPTTSPPAGHSRLPPPAVRPPASFTTSRPSCVWCHSLGSGEHRRAMARPALTRTALSGTAGGPVLHLTPTAPLYCMRIRRRRRRRLGQRWVVAQPTEPETHVDSFYQSPR
jgi:hypothetical protein